MTRPAAALLALALLAGCSPEEPAAPEPARLAPEAETAGAETDGAETDGAPEGFGGPLRGELLETATSEGDDVEVGVTTEVLFFRLAPEARKEVAEELEQEVPEDGLGASLGRALTGFVNDALASTVQIPLANVEDLRYEDGHLRFGSDGADVQFRDNGEDGIPMAEADAQRILDAFEQAR